MAALAAACWGEARWQQFLLVGRLLVERPVVHPYSAVAGEEIPVGARPSMAEEAEQMVPVARPSMGEGVERQTQALAGYRSTAATGDHRASLERLLVEAAASMLLALAENAAFGFGDKR